MEENKHTRAYGVETRNKIVDFIREFYEDNGYWPFIAHIVRGLKRPNSAIWKHVEVLKNMGIVDRKYGSYSEVRLLK